MKKLKCFYLYPCLILSLLSCGKFLDEKPDASLTEAKSLADIEALFNNTQVMNYYTMGLGEASCDNYYLDKSSWESLEQHERNMYVWGDEIFYDFYLNSWLDYYQTVYYSNYALGQLEKMKSSVQDHELYNDLKGRALFYRSFAFFKLVTLFSKAYDDKASVTEPGIPLRLSDDFNEPSTRASVEECYRQIIDDALLASELLPKYQAASSIPSRNAAYILLSWMHLLKHDFKNSEKYARESLSLNNYVLDFSLYSPKEPYPFLMGNQETVFSVGTGSLALLYYTYAKIDSTLYSSYTPDDYRKQLFFEKNTDGSVFFKGSYFGSNGLFMGFATTDSYLNLAESLIRQNKVSDGMSYLDAFLAKRYDGFKKGNRNDTSSVDEALSIVLSERRKEMVMRDSRWIDVKRLNKFEDGKIVLTRKLGNETMTLLPNDNRFALPLPQEVIMHSNLNQNPR